MSKSNMKSRNLTLEIHSSKSLTTIVRRLIDAAFELQIECGQREFVTSVLRFLVAAKLSIVFSRRRNAANVMPILAALREQKGSFLVEDTSIHVSAAPNEGLIDKCRKDVAQKLRPIVISTEDGLRGAFAFAREVGIHRNIELFEVEQFVATNLHQWSHFDGHQGHTAVRELINVYNDIVRRYEQDPRLMVSIG